MRVKSIAAAAAGVVLSVTLLMSLLPATVSAGHSHIAHLAIKKHVYEITKQLGPHLGHIMGAAAGAGLGFLGFTIVNSPLSPFPTPPLPLPPVGQQQYKHVLRYPGHPDRRPYGYSYLPPAQHPAFNNLEYGVYGNFWQSSNNDKYRVVTTSHRVPDSHSNFASVNEIGLDWGTR